MILKNCKAKWAKLDKPDEMSGKYSLDIYLTPEAVEQVEAEGIAVSSNDDGRFIRAKRKPDMGSPAVVDLMKNPVTGRVGNGSIINVIINPFDYDYKGKKGRGVGLEKVQVVQMKTYAGNEDFEADEAAAGAQSIRNGEDF